MGSKSTYFNPDPYPISGQKRVIKKRLHSEGLDAVQPGGGGNEDFKLACETFFSVRGQPMFCEASLFVRL
jgi:hypothetical protein